MVNFDCEGLSLSHFNMIIKMEYVKVNLRRRRKGMKELTFIDYYNSLSKRELKRLQKDSHAADCLRNGVFYIREKKLIRGLALLFECLMNMTGVRYFQTNHVLINASNG